MVLSTIYVYFYDHQPVHRRAKQTLSLRYHFKAFRLNKTYGIHVESVKRWEPLTILIICENAKQMKRRRRRKNCKEWTDRNYLNYLFERHLQFRNISYFHTLTNSILIYLKRRRQINCNASMHLVWLLRLLWLLPPLLLLRKATKYFERNVYRCSETIHSIINF